MKGPKIICGYFQHSPSSVMFQIKTCLFAILIALKHLNMYSHVSWYLYFLQNLFFFLLLTISYCEVDHIQAEIARQEARLKMERENLEKEKSVLMGTASNQDSQDGALEITVSGEKYRCLRFSKAKKWDIRLSSCMAFSWTFSSFF